MNEFMQVAIKEALNGINCGHGGPFGAVIVKDNEIIASGHNMVLLKNDPTCHGEISAIRNACEKLDTYDLSGCEIYTTGQPCPMCYCACKWANISKIYYGCTLEDNEIIGFRDKKFEKMFEKRNLNNDYEENINRDECINLFKKYEQMDKEIY